MATVHTAHDGYQIGQKVLLYGLIKMTVERIAYIYHDGTALLELVDENGFTQSVNTEDDAIQPA